MRICDFDYVPVDDGKCKNCIHCMESDFNNEVTYECTLEEATDNIRVVDPGDTCPAYEFDDGEGEKIVEEVKSCKDCIHCTESDYLVDKISLVCLLDADLGLAHEVNPADVCPEYIKREGEEVDDENDR